MKQQVRYMLETLDSIIAGYTSNQLSDQHVHLVFAREKLTVCDVTNLPYKDIN